MEIINHLVQGFELSLSLTNLGWCLLGTAVGTAVGVLPGLGPATTISLLLPVTFRMNPVSAIIMLSGIYYGAMYGGSITSILVRVPGEAASVVTCIDGYEMARRGRAGGALGIAGFGSFIAGLLATFGLLLVGPALAQHALDFGLTLASHRGELSQTSSLVTRQQAVEDARLHVTEARRGRRLAPEECQIRDLRRAILRPWVHRPIVSASAPRIVSRGILVFFNVIRRSHLTPEQRRIVAPRNAVELA